jgi:hypothetical protein
MVCIVVELKAIAQGLARNPLSQTELIDNTSQ